MKLYLAGPMSNLPLYNFPAFHAAASKLRAAGHWVVNPAEIDNGDTSQKWSYYMRKDISELMEQEAIAVLPGWENSRGAKLEVSIAEALEMPILDAETLKPVKRRYPRIALTGYARSGKDEIGKLLISRGYKRVAFGDIIKRQLDPLIRQHFGFSAFTEIDEEKRKIRGTLEHWGEDNYDAIFKEFFDTLPDVAVNTRLVRAREAQEWVRRGGIIVRVERPDRLPETDFAKRMADEITESGLVYATIVNGGSIEDLHASVESILFA